MVCALQPLQGGALTGDVPFDGLLLHKRLTKLVLNINHEYISFLFRIVAILFENHSDLDRSVGCLSPMLFQSFHAYSTVSIPQNCLTVRPE